MSNSETKLGVGVGLSCTLQFFPGYQRGTKTLCQLHNGAINCDPVLTNCGEQILSILHMQRSTNKNVIVKLLPLQTAH